MLPSLATIFRASVLATATAVALTALPQVPTSTETETQLAQSVRQFLELWLVKRDPKQAATMLSPTLRDERLLPSEWYSSSEYSQRFQGVQLDSEHPISAAQVRTRFEQYLGRILQTESLPAFNSVDRLLAPFAPADAQRIDPQLWRRISTREPRSLPQLPVLAYRVRSWQDISWTAGGAVGHRTLLSGLIDRERLDVQAVVSRMNFDLPEPALLFTLWTRSTTASNSQWGILSVEIPPSQ